VQIILAMDSDHAGQQAVGRFLENHVTEIDFGKMPAPDDLQGEAYRLWLRTLNVGQLIEELERLKTDDNAGADKVTMLLAEFEFCRKALIHEQHRNKYLEALKGL
jgi:hypothetical protein